MCLFNSAIVNTKMLLLVAKNYFQKARSTCLAKIVARRNFRLLSQDPFAAEHDDQRVSFKKSNRDYQKNRLDYDGFCLSCLPWLRDYKENGR